MKRLVTVLGVGVCVALISLSSNAQERTPEEIEASIRHMKQKGILTLKYEIEDTSDPAALDMRCYELRIHGENHAKCDNLDLENSAGQASNKVITDKWHYSAPSVINEMGDTSPAGIYWKSSTDGDAVIVTCKTITLMPLRSSYPGQSTVRLRFDAQKTKEFRGREVSNFFSITDYEEVINKMKNANTLRAQAFENVPEIHQYDLTGFTEVYNKLNCN